MWWHLRYEYQSLRKHSLLWILEDSQLSYAGEFCGNQCTVMFNPPLTTLSQLWLSQAYNVSTLYKEWSQEIEEAIYDLKCQIRASGCHSNHFRDPGTYNYYLANSSSTSWDICLYSQFLLHAIHLPECFLTLGRLKCFCLCYFCTIWNSYKFSNSGSNLFL